MRPLDLQVDAGYCTLTEQAHVRKAAYHLHATHSFAGDLTNRQERQMLILTQFFIVEGLLFLLPSSPDIVTHFFEGLHTSLVSRDFVQQKSVE